MLTMKSAKSSEQQKSRKSKYLHVFFLLNTSHPFECIFLPSVYFFYFFCSHGLYELINQNGYWGGIFSCSHYFGFFFFFLNIRVFVDLIQTFRGVRLFNKNKFWLFKKGYDVVMKQIVVCYDENRIKFGHIHFPYYLPNLILYFG